MEDSLNNSVSSSENDIENTTESEVKTVQNKKTSKQKAIKPDIRRGIPKSGRIWKTEKTRFSSIVKTKGIRDSFEKKQVLRMELKHVKDASRAIIAAKADEKEKKKERRRENIKRQEENRKKSEIVQVIKNTSKIKKFKKKLLRSVEKRDTTNM